MVFHVSTLLPHNPDDCLHLGKKRHIGNDVVAIIFQVILIGGSDTAKQLYHFSLHQQISYLYVQHSFGHSPILNSFYTFLFNQEEEVAFHPDMIKSNLLHAFLVVRPSPAGGYKMAVVTRSVLRNTHEMSLTPLSREDVPEFGPQISEVKVHAANRHLRWVTNVKQKYNFKTSCRRSILAKLINAEHACYKSRCHFTS